MGGGSSLEAGRNKCQWRTGTKDMSAGSSNTDSYPVTHAWTVFRRSNRVYHYLKYDNVCLCVAATVVVMFSFFQICFSHCLTFKPSEATWRLHKGWAAAEDSDKILWKKQQHGSRQPCLHGDGSEQQTVPSPAWVGGWRQVGGVIRRAVQLRRRLVKEQQECSFFISTTFSGTNSLKIYEEFFCSAQNNILELFFNCFNIIHLRKKPIY